MIRVAAALAALVVTGCATRDFGRMYPVSDAERRAMTCDQIAVEREKVRDFVSTVQRQRETDTYGKVAMVMAVRDPNKADFRAAQRSAIDRGYQLDELARDKGCR